MLFQDAHQDWQLEPDQDADDKDDQEEKELKPLQPRESQEQKRCRKTADQSHGQLHFDESRRKVAIEKPRQPRAHSERRKIKSDDERELRDRIADHIAGHRAGEQLVDKPAGCDD